MTTAAESVESVQITYCNGNKVVVAEDHEIYVYAIFKKGQRGCVGFLKRHWNSAYDAKSKRYRQRDARREADRLERFVNERRGHIGVFYVNPVCVKVSDIPEETGICVEYLNAE